MTLIDQVWGTTNERIHTVGTLFLGLSAFCAVTLGLKIKANGLFTFGCFAIGINLIGIAMLRNAWTRCMASEGVETHIPFTGSVTARSTAGASSWSLQPDSGTQGDVPSGMRRMLAATKTSEMWTIPRICADS